MANQEFIAALFLTHWHSMIILVTEWIC